MKLIELERIEFDRLIKKFEDEVLVSMGFKRLNKSMLDEMYWILRLLVTQNHYLKQRGFVTYLGKKSSNSNLLCNGKLLSSCKLYEMPFLISDAFYEIILNGNTTRLDRLVEAGILYKQKIPPEFSNQRSSKKKSAIFCYQISEIAKDIIPEDKILTKIDDKRAVLYRKYFHYKNNTSRNEYKRLIEMLESFYFDIPKKEIFMDRYKDLFIGNEYARDPDELLEMYYNQMVAFNNTDLDGFIIKLTSDYGYWAGRFYGTPAYIKSEFRKLLRFKATKGFLMEFDLRNSQFHFLNKVLKDYFGDDCTGKFDDDLKKYDIYRRIAQVVFNTNDPTAEQRDAVKGAMFYSFFRGSFEPSKETLEHEKQVMNTVKQLYPELVNAVEKLKSRKVAGFANADPYYFQHMGHSRKERKHRKRNSKRKVSFCATSMETSIMKQIWHDLWKAGIQYATVHDAILVDSSNPETLAEVRTTMREILERELGYIPEIREGLLVSPEGIPTDMEMAA